MADVLCAVCGVYRVESRSALYAYRCGCNTVTHWIDYVKEDMCTDVASLMALEGRMYWQVWSD